MEDDLLRLLAAAITGAIGWFTKILWGKVSKMEISMSNHKLYAAETYATKEDLNRGIDKIMEKLDKIDDKLDRKQDKGS